VPTLFLSHASEDKIEIVRPLAASLVRAGFNVWFDEYTLTLGDNLRRSIDDGLSKCDYGIVILSHKFFEKDWPQKELDGLVTREVDGRKLILPVWHQITKAEVSRYSPTLANRLAVKTDNGLHRVIEEIVRAVGRDANPFEAIGPQALQQLSSATQDPTMPNASRNTSAKDAVMNAIEFVEKLYESKDGMLPGSLSTGFRDLDGMTRGLRAGQLVAILGAPGSGKTSLLIGIAKHCVFTNARSVLYASDQLGATQLMLRVLAAASDVSVQRILEGYLREPDFPTLVQAATKLAASRFEIMDQIPITLEMVATRAEEMRQRGSLDILIVDHLDSIASVRSSRLSEREVAVADATATLRDIARKLEIPVVLTAAGRPRFNAERTQLHESELVLEYILRRDADVVASIQIGEPYDESGEPVLEERGTLTLLKNPFGVGDIPLHWEKSKLTFIGWEDDIDIEEDSATPDGHQDQLDLEEN
jgi:archaellum biogenesis ATPase FlaH